MISQTCYNPSSLSTAKSPCSRPTIMTCSLLEVVSVSANVLSALQLLERGTVCHLMLSQQTLLRQLRNDLPVFKTLFSHLVAILCFMLYFARISYVRSWSALVVSCHVLIWYDDYEKRSGMERVVSELVSHQWYWTCYQAQLWKKVHSSMSSSCKQDF